MAFPNERHTFDRQTRPVGNTGHPNDVGLRFKSQFWTAADNPSFAARFQTTFERSGSVANRYEFQFMMAPLLFRKGTVSPVNPIAAF